MAVTDRVTAASDAERDALRAAVRSLLERRSSGAARADLDSGTGYDHELWSRLCTEIGIAALAIPEPYGGLGATLLETHVVLEELGRRLTPSPTLGSAVLAAQALLHSGDAAACERLLPGIAAGSRIAALAWAGPTGGWHPEAVACAASGSGRLTGQARYVLDGAAADTLVVAAQAPDGIRLYLVDADQPGVRTEPVTTMDTSRRLATVALDGVPGVRLGTGNPLWRLRDVACVALSAEQVGAAARALELTVEYTRTRVQFGRPIASFQALAHRMADLRVAVDSARSTSYAAASALLAGQPDAADPLDAAALAAAAKVHCSETLQRVAAEMIQLHGGIAITWEHDAHRYFKRAHGDAQLFGAPREHVARLAELVLDA